jgi:hypothetical protein
MAPTEESQPEDTTDEGEYPTQGPRAVATVFKVAAFLALLGGMFSSVYTGGNLATSSSLSTGSVISISIGIAIGAILVAAALAFFAYMLELLLDIRESCEILADGSLGSE